MIRRTISFLGSSPLKVAAVLGLFCAVVAAQQKMTKADTLRELSEWRISRGPELMNDFAELHRYRDANAKLPRPEAGENRVVFLGDSITDGWRLAEFFPGKPYVNRGITGQTTPQMLIRFRPDVIALEPKVVVILAGTNEEPILPRGAAAGGTATGSVEKKRRGLGA